ncbi:MAG: NAD(P)/FAD-dependent oxidoreductase [Prevotellaceae bacterium]|jgi:all-trans-retinol 13,14-reductase|nr:NAD(P)/FAD-dependent oxidoreductase [Prevotellaceae bacterium]
MKQYDVAIIGSGLGGLQCGYILAKKGYNVCILEKEHQLGGCLQTFKRNGTFFDTGFHYVGGLEEGQFLHTLFSYFDLLDLPWHKMDESGFAEVVLKDKSYFIPSGFDRFVDTLSNDFPHQQRHLKNYADFLKHIGENVANNFKAEGVNFSLFEQSAYSFLQNTIGDSTLQSVLSGASLTMELCAEKLPLYTFAQINSTFIQSAWRLNGGGSLIANKLADSIRTMGGTVLTKAKVTRLIEKNGEITTVEYNDTEQIATKYVISNLHPTLALSLIPESERIRNIYRKRIAAIPNTYGMFTVQLQLEENIVPYLNRNIFIHKEENLWDCSYHPTEKVSAALISYQLPKQGEKYTANIDILTPMHWQEIEKWNDTTVGRRGEEYLAFKQKKAEECIALAAERIPELKNSINKIYTSTPLTYRDYTGTMQGSAYGIQKDCNNVLQTILTPKTPISNLLLTGQNLNLHGIFGVTMTSFFTCAEIVGMESLVRDLPE